MIRSREDYLYYLEADRIALGRPAQRFRDRVIQLIAPDYIWDFQRLLRRVEYLGNVRRRGIAHRILYLYWRLKYRRLSVKLSFSIPPNVFGPGLAIVHYGTIVINENARVGANCRIHVCTNVGASGGTSGAPQLGDNVYLAPGAKIIGDIRVPSNTAVGANAVVNKSFSEENTLIAGVPAKVIKPIDIRTIIKHL
jgi:serine O-acetyltransferase